MNYQSFTMRLRSLEGLVDQAYSLIEEYENIRLVERDPRRRRECLMHIEQLRDQVRGYRDEYDQLRRSATASDLSSLSETLVRIEAKLGALLAGQERANVELEALLELYEAGERAIIVTLVEHFDESLLASTRDILNGIEANPLPESELRQLVHRTLELLQKQRQILPPHDRIEAALSDTSLEVKHKIKLAIPLIPLLVRYEGEVELGTRVTLGEQWRALKEKFRR